MKKRIASIFLTLVLTLSLAGTALADGTTVTPVPPNGNVTATLSADGTYIDLTVTGLTSKNQYLVLMVSGIVDKPEDAQVTESTIKYIDQASSDGTVTFKVYPSSMESSTILLSGSDVPLTIVATVEMSYTLGDVNNDGNVSMIDATMVAQHAVKLVTLTGNQFLSADVTHDSNVSMVDATKIAQYAVKIITSFD